MLNILFLVMDEQLAILDRLYDGVVSASNCDLRRLSSEQQEDLKAYFRNIDVHAYDVIMLMLRNKKVMKQVRFLKTLPNLAFLEHDAWQNYFKCKYRKKFSRLYKALPGCTVVSSGFNVSEKLKSEGVDCHFVPKGFDQEILRNLGWERDIESAFVGSVKNKTYKKRERFLSRLEKDNHIKVLRTAPGREYLETLNRIRFFISADIGFGEYMLKNFEAMACGCVLFAFDQGESENHALGFRDMENVVLYRSLEELLEKMALVKGAPDRERQIRDAGQALVEQRFRFDFLGREVVKALESSHFPDSSSR